MTNPVMSHAQSLQGRAHISVKIGVLTDRELAVVLLSGKGLQDLTVSFFNITVIFSVTIPLKV
jgi:hypothetical protein